MTHSFVNKLNIIMSIKDLISAYQETQSASWKGRRRNELLNRKEDFLTYFNSLPTTEEQHLKAALPFMFS